MKGSFWKWLFRGLNGKPGLYGFIDWWLPVHIAVGIVLAKFVDVPPHDAAKTVLLPFASIFIGLSFAWAGNAQALLKEREIEKVTENHRDGLEHYVYTFQLAIFVILITLSAWGLAGLKVFKLQVFSDSCVQFGIETGLYFLASLTLRECWHVVLGSQFLILTRHEYRKEEDEHAKDPDS